MFTPGFKPFPWKTRSNNLKTSINGKKRKKKTILHQLLNSPAREGYTSPKCRIDLNAEIGNLTLRR